MTTTTKLECRHCGAAITWEDRGAVRGRWVSTYTTARGTTKHEPKCKPYDPNFPVRVHSPKEDQDHADD